MTLGDADGRACRRATTRAAPPGFAHGMVTAVAPDIDPSRPGEAARVCGDARTRYQEYSCVHGFGHAFMRIYGDELEPALKLCRELGERAAADCAQGAYHDYWFAVAGADDATPPEPVVRDPRALCGAAPRGVRAAVLVPGVDREPPGGVRRSRRRRTSTRSASGSRGLQREACITAAAVIGPRRPGRAARACARGSGRRPTRRAACAGRRCRTCSSRPPGELVALVDGCARFAGGDARPRATAGSARRPPCSPTARSPATGCPRLRGAAARRACADGAATMDEALETFS